MVEFGLKLEDNRVAAWADKYVDYKKLKKCIRNITEAVKKREELEKRNPVEAERLKRRKSFMMCLETDTASIHSRRTSLGSLSNVAETKRANFQMDYNNENDKNDNITDDEFTPLTSRRNSKAGLKSSTSYASLQGAFSSVAAYFKTESYEDKLRFQMLAEDDFKTKFRILILEEIDKVNEFYNSKHEEIKQQLEALVNSIPEDLAKNMNDDTNKVLLRAQSYLIKGTSFFIKKQNKIDKKESNSSDDEKEDEKDKFNVERYQSFRFKESNSIQRAIIDLHRQTTLLLNFAVLNYTGFVKIIKKYEKKVANSKGHFTDITKYTNNDGKSAKILVDTMETYYANWFCGGNIREAQVRMLPKRGDNMDMDWSQLRLGYRMGMCAILTVWVCWDCVWGLIAEGKSTIGGRAAFPVFRGCGGLLVFHWCWTFSTFTWSRFRVNYIYLFDFDPRIINSPMTHLSDVVDETLVFLILMLLYYKAGASDIPSVLPTGAYPFMLIMYTVFKLIFPLKTRKPLWKAISSVVTAPLNSPSFFMTYVGDVFTSMVKVFQDILWIICFVLSGDFLESNIGGDNKLYAWHNSFWYKHVAIPLICLAPLWFRFHQCLRKYYDTKKRYPHLANAFKYALSQTVTLFGAFHPLYLMYNHNDDENNGAHLFQFFWTGLFVCSSLYSWCWDVYVDWGLGRYQDMFLGKMLMFPKKLYYYMAIIVDLFLRFMWVLTLVPPQSGAKFELPNYLNAITMIIELLRRTMWSFFRLENEHRSNTSEFRRVGFVPLHFDTGHNHKYKKQEKQGGWAVLIEVLIVTFTVVGISISSIIAAQKATDNVENV